MVIVNKRTEEKEQECCVVFVEFLRTYLYLFSAYADIVSWAKVNGMRH